MNEMKKRSEKKGFVFSAQQKTTFKIFIIIAVAFILVSGVAIKIMEHFDLKEKTLGYETLVPVINTITESQIAEFKAMIPESAYDTAGYVDEKGVVYLTYFVDDGYDYLWEDLTTVYVLVIRLNHVERHIAVFSEDNVESSYYFEVKNNFDKTVRLKILIDKKQNAELKVSGPSYPLARLF